MDQDQKQPEPQAEWLNSGYGAPEIYGNSVNVTWTLFDVRLALGQLVPKKEADLPGGFIVEKRGAITIAWPQAKNLLLTLADIVGRYEKVNGEIKPLKLPPSGPKVSSKPSEEPDGGTNPPAPPTPAPAPTRGGPNSM